MEELEEELIEFKTAKLAKEKGFNVHCKSYYVNDTQICENEDFPYNSWSNNLFAPTQSLLQKWLREKHKLEVHVSFNPDWDFKKDSNECLCKNNGYRVDWGFVGVWKTYKKNAYPLERKNIKTYEEALELGLLESLKLI